MELMTQMPVALTDLEIGEGGAIAHIALPPSAISDADRHCSGSGDHVLPSRALGRPQCVFSGRNRSCIAGGDCELHLRSAGTLSTVG